MVSRAMRCVDLYEIGVRQLTLIGHDVVVYKTPETVNLTNFWTIFSSRASISLKRSIRNFHSRLVSMMVIYEHNLVTFFNN